MTEKDIYIIIDCIENLSQNNNFINMRKYIQHGKTDCLFHSIAVAYYSYAAATSLNLDFNKKNLTKGALLHDFFLYDWHEADKSHRLHGFTHPKTALKNALCVWELNDREKDIIVKHMFPLTLVFPYYKESVLVCIIDKICSITEIFYLPPCSKVKELYDYAIKLTK